MWTKTKTVAALLSMYIAQGAAKTRGGAKMKEGKQVCLEYVFLNDVVAKGSSTPIGSAGPNGLGACYPSGYPGPVTPIPALPSAVCCTELKAALTLTSGNFDKYFKCLRDPKNGPVLVGDWWLQRDVNNGEIYFKEGAVCAQISASAMDSKTTLELWDEKYINMPLGLFKEFKVDYDVIDSPGANTGYLNFYLRSAASNTNYYDCRFDFLIPNAVGRGTLAITPDTVKSASGGSCPSTIKDYLAANPNAVMGVGNGEKYAFVLVTGSTGQNNSGQHTCWSNVSIERVDAVGTKFFDTYEFTTL